MWLKQQAIENNRSFSGEVVYRLALSRAAQIDSSQQKGQQP